MISKRALKKLENKILFTLYNNYYADNEVSLDNLTLSGLFIATNPKYITIDEHDIYLALRGLVADGLITVNFKEFENWDSATITSNGITYCQANRDNKFISYLKRHHLAVIDLILSTIAIIISIIALTN